MIALFVILMGLFFLICISSSMFVDTASQQQLSECGVSLHSPDAIDNFNNDDHSLLEADYFIDLNRPEILFNEERCLSHDL